MTENKGDLISREALKKALSEPLYRSTIKDFGEVIEYTRIMNTIDNAPTVEPCYQTTSCLDCKIYDKEKHNCPRFCEVIRSAIEERPQGEWLKDEEHSITINMFRCSNCNGGGYTHFKYCPNCGASMKPKANQLRDCENCIHHSDNGCEVWECEFKRRSS